jgi:hypothetical protein
MVGWVRNKADPNNLENILIAWILHQPPGNYHKFRSLPSGKTKVAVCEEVSKTNLEVKTLKIHKAPPLCSPEDSQAMEGSFHEAHDWVNNMGVGERGKDCENKV